MVQDLSVHDYQEGTFFPHTCCFLLCEEHELVSQSVWLPMLLLTLSPTPPLPDGIMYLISDFGRRNWTYTRCDL